jgi:phage N-6-adenine-methyltransferase
MAEQINRCESCGPILDRVYPYDGTHWCKACMLTEGWPIPKMPQQKPGRSKQDYGTPPELLAAIKHRLHINKFSVDLAATESNRVADWYIGEEDNALTVDWHMLPMGWLWLNPPYAKIEPWVKKAKESAEQGAHIAMLVPASVGSNWWTQYVEPYAFISYLVPRLTFVGAKDPYPKDCALLLYEPWGYIGHEHWYWKNTYDHMQVKQENN